MINTDSKHWYALTIFYRFFLAFIVGYLCANYFAFNLTLLFQFTMANAEAIYLAAFISIFFFMVFVIYSFITQSLKKLTTLSVITLSSLFVLSKILG